MYIFLFIITNNKCNNIITMDIITNVVRKSWIVNLKIVAGKASCYCDREYDDERMM